MNRNRTVNCLRGGLLAVAGFSLLFSEPVMAQSGTRSIPSGGQVIQRRSVPPQTNYGVRAATKVGMDGYCPVCIIDAKKWMKGNPNIASTFDGVTYYFPSENVKATFDQNPQKYVPALNGDCIVCLAMAGKRMAGNVRNAATYRGRVYMFPGAGERQKFLASPESYANTDLAMNGDCVVCYAKMGQRVPGTRQYTVMHNGMRYQFPSAKEANMFKASPAEFARAVPAPAAGSGTRTMPPASGSGTRSLPPSAGSGTRNSPELSQTSFIKVEGKSGCAACGHGVHPIGSPDELGLAITSWDGKVTVVEGAHQDYPEIYKNRFSEIRLLAEGSVVKQEGNVTWLKPKSLVAL